MEAKLNHNNIKCTEEEWNKKPSCLPTVSLKGFYSIQYARVRNLLPSFKMRYFAGGIPEGLGQHCQAFQLYHRTGEVNQPIFLN